jgi:ribose transport system ATP-binding protein
MAYITHKLEEIFKICDRVTVLRDGMLVDAKGVTEVTKLTLIRKMVGSDFTESAHWRNTPHNGEVLSASSLTNKYVKDIAFDVYGGEVLGISGLMGSGRTELAKTIYGYYGIQKGEIFLNRKKVNIENCRQAIKEGIVYISEDRKDEGLIGPMSIRDNITITVLQRISNKIGFIRHRKERELVQDLIKRLKIKIFSMNQRVETLSGGNQQKVSISKGLVCKPLLLILDEPSRGVDVGARREIYNIINELKSQGLAVIIISSDIEEIISICDRVIVMFNGSISGILNRADLDKEKILKMAFNA